MFVFPFRSRSGVAILFKIANAGCRACHALGVVGVHPGGAGQQDLSGQASSAFAKGKQRFLSTTGILNVCNVLHFNRNSTALAEIYEVRTHEFLRNFDQF